MKNDIESQNQQALIRWATLTPLPAYLRVEGANRMIDHLYAIPNGGGRSKREAGILKAEGVKSGVSDLHFDAAVGNFRSLWIEMKRPIIKGKPKPTTSPSQTLWLVQRRALSSAVAVCYGWAAAKWVLTEYVAGRLPAEYLQIIDGDGNRL